MIARPAIPEGSPVVVKVGSSSLAFPQGGVDPDALRRVVDQVADAWEAGYPTVLVTSAAIAAGLPLLGMKARPVDLPGLQMAAAVGQVSLMSSYAVEFARRGLIAGQVLLTKDVLANREQYVHSREALEAMLKNRIVPVVNENDTVVVDELKLGDNDRLAAIVSHLAGARLLVLLTDTPGLYSGDPRGEPDAELLTAVQDTDAILDRLAKGGSGPLGSGGVATKVAAARMAAWSGIPTVVAAAKAEGTVLRALSGEEVGTWVAPKKAGLSARRLWIAFGLPATGTVRVDAGAATALVRDQRSLLPVGVTEVVGSFEAGRAVEIVDGEGALVAKGLASLDDRQLRRIMGRRTVEVDGWEGVVVHRDDLVVLAAD